MSTASSLSVPLSPRLDPAYSLTSSVASLEPLDGPDSTEDLHSAMRRTVADTAALVAERIEQEGGVEVERTPKVRTVEMEAEETVVPDDGGEWEEVEVGRGLANYNSDEVHRVKGTKR